MFICWPRGRQIPKITHIAEAVMLREVLREIIATFGLNSRGLMLEEFLRKIIATFRLYSRWVIMEEVLREQCYFRTEK